MIEADLAIEPGLDTLVGRVVLARQPVQLPHTRHSASPGARPSRVETDLSVD